MIVPAAGADVWEATKRALKKARKVHDGGQEANIDDADGKTYADYIIPNDPSQQDAAIDAITADFAALKEVAERWWLGPPDSRWGTGMESAQQKIQPKDQGYKDACYLRVDVKRLLQREWGSRKILAISAGEVDHWYPLEARITSCSS